VSSRTRTDRQGEEPPGAEGPPSLTAGPLELRTACGLALAEGRALMLTAREFGVLCELARRHEEIVARETLYAAAWGEPMRAGDRSVDVYVRRLRVKLAEALPRWRFIHTHFALGYRFDPQPKRSASRARAERRPGGTAQPKRPRT
jgi:DNA-binding response OmpR family regulator